MSYGTAAAPFLAVRSLFFIADFFESKFSVGSETLRQNLYVDDLLTGADIFNEVSIEDTKFYTRQVWNCPNGIRIAPCDGEMQLETTDEYITKALGMSWNNWKL